MTSAKLPETITTHHHSIKDEAGNTVAQAWSPLHKAPMPTHDAKALAAEICRRYNAHGELVEALDKCETALLSFLDSCDEREIKHSFSYMQEATKQARALLAEVKKGE